MGRGAAASCEMGYRIQPVSQLRPGPARNTSGVGG